jgi:hypothetical protein
MEFKGTKSILTMPCGATSGTNQDRPSNVIYSKGKVLAKFYGETPEEATANAKIFSKSLQLLELLNHFVEISDELSCPDHLIETFANLYANAFNTIQESTTI